VGTGRGKEQRQLQHMKAKMALKGRVYDGLVQGGHSGYDVDPVMEEIDAE